MESIRYSAFVLLVILLLMASCFDPKKERKLVKEAWVNYTTTLAINQGKESVKYLDSGSINYYEYMADIIRTADSETVEKLKFDQKILVLSIRDDASRDKILQFNGKSLFAYCVQIGMCSYNGMVVDKLNITSINEREAKGQLVDSAGITKPLILYFRKEDEHWKIDLVSILGQVGRGVWDDVIRESGKTEKQLLNDMLKNMSDSVPHNNIWKPIN